MGETGALTSMTRALFWPSEAVKVSLLHFGSWSRTALIRKQVSFKRNAILDSNEIEIHLFTETKVDNVAVQLNVSHGEEQLSALTVQFYSNYIIQ